MSFVVASTTVDKIQNTHISDTPPVVPTIGQLWNDTTQQPPLLKMWNGAEWEAVHTSIKQLDPVAFEDINKMIDDAISGAEQDRNKIQEAIDKANDALKQAGLNDTEITAIKQIQSEDGKKINQIQVNYNGLQQSVKDLDSKTESYHTQLAEQITDVVKEQGNLSQQIQTATGNISSVQDSQNNMNRELQTAKETIQQISSKTESNTELINTVKQTSDSNSQKIVDTSGKVSIVEQTLNGFNTTVSKIQTGLNSAKEQIESQQTQINQKPDRTEIIASSNENPKAYFKVGTFSDGPNVGKGYVSVGADYGFFLNTNTFISDGFTLSANNISAGTIHGNKLSWADDIDTPSYFKDNDGKATKPILNLKVGQSLDEKTMNEFYLSGVSSERNSIENDTRYSIIDTSYSQSQISFQNYDWQKGKENNDTLHQSQSGFIKGKYSPVNKECTGIELRSGGSALVIEDVYARDQLNTTNEFAKYVQVGKDFDGYPCLSTPSIYTDYIMSSKGEANKGITFNDRLNLTEGIYSDWDKSGRKTYIDFPSENGGDTITFHTADGEGAYGNYHSYFKLTTGDWTAGGVANQHHAFVVGGDGYILSFSNEEGDNAQGNANATLVASRYVTNSTRKLKEDIKPIDNIEQATQDILKIEPKQYLYKDQAEKIKQWKENGKPADEFKHIDTRINIGLIAEDLDEYESLQPFIEKVSDEEGNEGILGIDYSKLTPLLLAVCRRQDDKINKLEERLVRMELLMKDLHK